MKRQELIRKIEKLGCVLIRRGGRHGSGVIVGAVSGQAARLRQNLSACPTESAEEICGLTATLVVSRR